MHKAKFRKIEQQKTYTHRAQYDNALTRVRAKNRPKSLSFVEIDIGDGEMANVYFTPLPGTVLKLREEGLEPLRAYNIMLEILTECVVEPETGKPLYTLEEWEKEDPEFVSRITGAVMGIQFVRDDEEVQNGEVIEVEVEDTTNDSSAASDPNPLDETPGSVSPISSTLSLEGADEKEQAT